MQLRLSKNPGYYGGLEFNSFHKVNSVPCDMSWECTMDNNSGAKNHTLHHSGVWRYHQVLYKQGNKKSINIRPIKGLISWVKAYWQIPQVWCRINVGSIRELWPIVAELQRHDAPHRSLYHIRSFTFRQVPSFHFHSVIDQTLETIRASSKRSQEPILDQLLTVLIKKQDNWLSAQSLCDTSPYGALQLFCLLYFDFYRS